MTYFPQAAKPEPVEEVVVETTETPATTVAPVVGSLPELDLMGSAVTGTVNTVIGCFSQRYWALYSGLFTGVRQRPSKCCSEVHVAFGAALLALA